LFVQRYYNVIIYDELLKFPGFNSGNSKGT